MNFAPFSFILIMICGVQISIFDRLTPVEVDYLHSNHSPLTINYTEESEPCRNITRIQNKFKYPGVLVPHVFLYCDSHYKHVKNEPNSTICTGFDCWESQLSTVSRVEIADIMNKYREKVAKGQCLKWCERNKNKFVFELEWNYFLEQNATGFLKACARNRFIERQYFLAGLDDYVTRSSGYKELVATSFKMETGLQSEMRSILWRLMYENRLKDWDKEWQYRRGDMNNVACAFACRRGVNYVTDLNETVVNGIVGHLSCVFATVIVNSRTVNGETEVAPLNTTREPSYEFCGLYYSFMSINNHYPTLCRLMPDLYYADLLLYHGCDFRPGNASQLCPESKYSPITWEEKHYGLMLSFKKKLPNGRRAADVEQCNNAVLPPLPDLSNATYLLLCTLTEVVAVQANLETCFGWNCADSQLTDATRVFILDSLNRARNLVAKGECSEDCPPPCKRCNPNAQYCNVVNLQWHWYLERKASQIVENCPTNYSIRKNLKYDDDPFPIVHQTSFEEITLLFDLPFHEGQMALPKTISKLFWMNAFEDWTDYHYFRRGNAQYVGCAIVSRPYAVEIPPMKPEMNFYNGMPTHMVCLYASLNGSFNSVLGEASNEECCPVCSGINDPNPCWLLHVKNVTPVESLCYVLPLIITQNCQIDKRCDDGSISKAWYMQYKSITVVQTINGSLIVMERKASNSIGILYERAYCQYVVFLFVLQALLWIFLVYFMNSLEDVRFSDFLKKTLFRPHSPGRKKTAQKKSVKKKLSRKEAVEEKLSGNKSIQESSPRKISTEKTSRKSDGVQSSAETLAKDVAGSKAATKRTLVKKSKKTTTLPPEPRTTSRITTPAPSTAPVAKKTPIREARPEDDRLGEEEMEPYPTGPTVTIRVNPVGPRRLFTGRPPKERKAPKRAKTTKPPIQKKK